MKILILNLVAFAQMGGVEKVGRILAKAGSDIAKASGGKVMNLSLYDTNHDERYTPKEEYKGFNKNKKAFILEALKQGWQAEYLILAHVNLALPALLIKLLNPRIRIFLIAHGIEIWNPLSKVKQRLLHWSTRILAVSNYTKQRISQTYPALNRKIEVINNCLDPFYIPASSFEKPEYLQKRYQIKTGEKVLLTLCRLSSSEKYKGYDTVIESLKGLEASYSFKYILLGKYDETEYQRLQQIIEHEGLKEKVILAGFVKDEELSDHFLLGDLFIMPSIKEGFGIAFIEAAASGMPVIAGNKDGSVDALLNGKLGPLVDPGDKEAIRAAIDKVLNSPPLPHSQQAIALNHFNFTVYKTKLKAALQAVAKQ